MIIFKNVMKADGTSFDLSIESEHQKTYEGKGLLALPAVIDPHVHFRTPGLEHKENWLTAAKAALRGGCTTVFDMPNTLPPTITRELLLDKQNIINSQLKQINIPLRYRLFFGADKNHLAQIPHIKNTAIGIKVFMGCSTGNLVIDDDESLDRVFAIAAEHRLLVAVHAEDEHAICEAKRNYQGELNYAAHSRIRNIEVATKAVKKAIQLTKKYGTTLYILHVSTKEEIELIREAKKAGLPVYAETTPHHLFFNDSQYEALKGKAVVNPPLRDVSHQAFLFAAIREGVIDTIGSDHAPHTIDEKNEPYGRCPSGMPGIEFMLPLLLNAYHEQKLTLQDIQSLTSSRAKKIFDLPETNDWVIVDLERSEEVTKTLSRCDWTPYEGLRLKGWPVYTVLKGVVYEINEMIKNGNSSQASDVARCDQPSRIFINQ